MPAVQYSHTWELTSLVKTEGPGRNLGLKLQRSAEELPATGTGTSLENCFRPSSTQRYRDDGDPRVLHSALSQGLWPRRCWGQIQPLPSLSLKNKRNKTPFGQLALINATSNTFWDKICFKKTKASSL